MIGKVTQLSETKVRLSTGQSVDWFEVMTVARGAHSVNQERRENTMADSSNF